MRERAASYDGSWSTLRSAFELIPPVEKQVKTKTGLTTLDGNLVTTLTKAEFDRFRAEDAARIHVVSFQQATYGGDAA